VSSYIGNLNQIRFLLESACCMEGRRCDSGVVIIVNRREGSCDYSGECVREELLL